MVPSGPPTMLRRWLVCVCLAPMVLLAQEAPLDSGRFESFDGTRIYYESRGSGKPVVLIHGFISSSESWKRTALFSDLLDAGYRVILIDLRGNGKSGRPHESEAFENDAEAMDVGILADKLGLRSYAAVGYSRGAIIASRVALLDKRVNSIVLGGMGADFTNPEWPRRHNIYKALAGEPNSEFAGLIDRIKKDSQLDQLCLAYMQKSQPVTSQKELASIRKPVLVICGDKDEDNGSSKTLSEMIPGSAYVRVPGIHNDTARSKDFSTHVNDFLARSTR
jgi:pimeloyl-ACP methyl ester carboxylesterase